MKEDIDAIFEKYFPADWNIEAAHVFAAQSNFDLYNDALEEGLNKPIRDLIFRGGKRIRPLLFLTLLKSFGKDPKNYLDFAFIVELVHNGTLVVDDIEDGSDLRRGKPALHKTFGTDVALNAGVAMHILPLKLLVGRNDISQTQRLKLFEIYTEEATNVYLGQTIDINWHNNIPPDVTESNYFEMARLKTGSLARMAVRFAATLTEQSEEVTKALTVFAESAGIAFQIKDDALDLTADAEEFGKPFGQDISEGKISLPVVLAFQELPEDKASQLRSILRDHTTEHDQIIEAQTIIKSTSAIENAMQKAEKVLQTAWSEVEQVVPDGEGKDLLQNLTESFIARSS